MAGSFGGFLLRGAVAGTIGAFVMDRVTWAMQDREDKRALETERVAWPRHLDVSHGLANRLGAGRRQPGLAGMATHYALSIGPAILYAGLRSLSLKTARDRGLLYGLAIFLLWDETLSTGTGIADEPAAYPWQAHLRGLIGHLALGVATHAALTPLERDFDLRPIDEHPGA